MRLFVLTALLGVSALAFTPALAADQGVTKGGKSYQQARPEAQPSSNTSAQTEDRLTDVTTLEPAAGQPEDQAQTPQTEKTFKEEIRLPRKN